MPNRLPPPPPQPEHSPSPPPPPATTGARSHRLPHLRRSRAGRRRSRRHQAAIRRRRCPYRRPSRARVHYHRSLCRGPPAGTATTAPPRKPIGSQHVATAAPNQPEQMTNSPGWRSELGAWLQTNKTYPDEARRRGEEGRATVRFTVNREGQVLDFQLLSSTGSRYWMRRSNGCCGVRDCRPFPTGMDQEKVTVTLQIRYSLER